MALRVEEAKVEVDMVPLIDIVTLVLLFLVIVGDTAKSASAVKMKLPRLDQAKNVTLNTEGRIVLQLAQDPKTLKYRAVANNLSYDLDSGSGLDQYLEGLVNSKLAGSGQQRNESKQAPFPVKLRIPAGAPMKEVEKLVQACARNGLTNVHYASEKLN
jgi:biopolymer transport protein ExbD